MGRKNLEYFYINISEVCHLALRVKLGNQKETWEKVEIICGIEIYVCTWLLVQFWFECYDLCVSGTLQNSCILEY